MEGSKEDPQQDNEDTTPESGDQPAARTPGSGGSEPVPEPPPEANDERPAWAIANDRGDNNEFLRVHIAGSGVGQRTIRLDSIGDLLVALRKSLHAVTGWLAGVPISQKNEIATPPGAAEPLFAGLIGDNSIVLLFELGSDEVPVYIETGDDYRYQTEVAAETLVQVLGANDITALIDLIRPMNDRVANTIVELVEQIARDKLNTDWSTRDRQIASVTADTAINNAVSLRKEELVQGEPETLTGELFRADSRKNSFRFEPDDGRAFTGTYPEVLQPWVREAWGKTVRIVVQSTEFRHPYEEQAHRVEYELVEPPEILGALDEGSRPPATS